MKEDAKPIEFQLLDEDCDEGISVAKGDLGTFYIETNTDAGRSCTRIWFHPRIAIALRDWLAAHYKHDDNPTS